MNNLNHKKIFFNRADVQEAERICCDNCFEQVVFLLKDNDHSFSIGLRTVLECLAFAVKNGELPKLPMSWVNDADIVCGTEFSEDKKVCYFNYDNKGKRI